MSIAIDVSHIPTNNGMYGGVKPRSKIQKTYENTLTPKPFWCQLVRTEVECGKGLLFIHKTLQIVRLLYVVKPSTLPTYCESTYPYKIFPITFSMQVACSSFRSAWTRMIQKALVTGTCVKSWRKLVNGVWC